MASRLARVFQKIFGSSGDTSQFESFGSDAAGASVKTKDLATIMGTSAWLQGWLQASGSANQPPRLEDFNALDLLLTTQLAYLFQEGIPEYDPSTSYYYGSLCQIGGTIYTSVLDSTGATANIGNNPATDTGTNWGATLGGLVPGAGWPAQLEAAFSTFVAPNASQAANSAKLATVTPGALGLAVLALSGTLDPSWGTALTKAVGSGAANGIDAKTLATVKPGTLGLALLALVGTLGANVATILGNAIGAQWPATLQANGPRTIDATSGTLGTLTVTTDITYLLVGATTATLPPPTMAGQRITFKNCGNFTSTISTGSNYLGSYCNGPNGSFSLYAMEDYVTFEADGGSTWRVFATNGPVQSSSQTAGFGPNAVDVWVSMSGIGLTLGTLAPGIYDIEMDCTLAQLAAASSAYGIYVAIGRELTPISDSAGIMAQASTVTAYAIGSVHVFVKNYILTSPDTIQGVIYSDSLNGQVAYNSPHTIGKITARRIG
jgi:hypothetical protein